MIAILTLALFFFTLILYTFHTFQRNLKRHIPYLLERAPMLERAPSLD